MNYEAKEKNTYRIEWNKQEGQPVARAMGYDPRRGVVPSCAFICLDHRLRYDNKPNFLTDQQWAEAKAMLEADDNKIF